VSSKRMQTLKNLKRTFTLTREDLIYIQNYQRIYKRVIQDFFVVTPCMLSSYSIIIPTTAHNVLMLMYKFYKFYICAVVGIIIKY